MKRELKNVALCVRCMLRCLTIACFILSSWFVGVIYADGGPIDIVYTWVDGSDVDWQLQKAKYSRMYGKELSRNDAVAVNRFRNRDELRYSLRSVFKYAPFINHIYIVTCGQTPVWLRPHPKITVISHQEIFPNKEDLPTFNSQAIEANLHRIPNLAEKFIYFNDDVFLGSAVTSDDFYTPDGKVKFFFGTKNSPAGEIKPGELSYHSAWKNTNALLNTTFKEEPRFHMLHTPDPCRKSLTMSCERWFPEIFRNVSTHKFRMSCDYTLTNGLIPYFAIYTGRGVAAEIPNKTVWFGASFKRNVTELFEITRIKYKTFCIEDSQTAENEHYDIILRQFLDFYFPDPAPWEKTSPYAPELFSGNYDQAMPKNIFNLKKLKNKSVIDFLERKSKEIR